MRSSQCWLLSLLACGAVVVGCNKTTAAPPPADQGSQSTATNAESPPQELSAKNSEPDSKLAGEANASSQPSTKPTVSSVSRPRGGSSAPEYKLPEPPKADKTVGLVYEEGAQKIEVEGVCHITEASIGCWNTNGDKSQSLEEKIKNALTKRSQYGGMSNTSFSFQYGKKNRVIVLKQTTKRIEMSIKPGDPPVYLASAHIQSVGSDPYSGGGSNIYLDFNEARQEDGAYVRYEIRTVAEEVSKTTTVVRLQRSEPLPESPTMPCKVGASMVIDGRTYKVSAIKKGADDQSGFYGQPPQGQAWTIEVSSSVPSGKNNFYASFSIADESGTPIMYASKDGNPVSQKEYSAYIEEVMKAQTDPTSRKRNPGDRIQAKFAQATSGMSSGSSSNGTYISKMVVYVDPAKISKLVGRVTRTSIIDMTGILLDPK